MQPIKRTRTIVTPKNAAPTQNSETPTNLTRAGWDDSDWDGFFNAPIFPRLDDGKHEHITLTKAERVRSNPTALNPEGVTYLKMTFKFPDGRVETENFFGSFAKSFIRDMITQHNLNFPTANAAIEHFINNPITFDIWATYRKDDNGRTQRNFYASPAVSSDI